MKRTNERATPMPLTLIFGDVRVLADTADEAVALLHSMNGHKGHTAARRGRRAKRGETRDAAHRATYSPGSLDARILDHVKTSGPIAPGELALAMHVDKGTSRRVVAALVKAHKLTVTGTTMSRRITLA